MKLPRMSGQGVVLCLSAVLALAPAQVQSPQRARPSPPPNETMVVWHREGVRYRIAAELPVVARVRTLLEPAVRRAVPGLTNAEFARRTLAEHFGTRMTESAALPHYMWVLIDGQWVIVCLSVAEFEIDFGRWGHVVVQTEHQMPLD